jgi:hypothetical protein
MLSATSAEYTSNVDSISAAAFRSAVAAMKIEI